MKHSNIAFFIPHVGCPNRCSFCNQSTISGVKDIPDGNFVRKTLDFALKNMSYDAINNSEIAFFGGSFTAINREYMIELLKAANEFIGQEKFNGIRISTRPDAIDDEIVSILKEYNVCSVELGAQSMNDEVLRKNFRGHSSEDVVKSSEILRNNGFSLGLQMMTGLYGDTEKEAENTAKKLISLKPNTVRIYPTVVLKDTYLEKLYYSGEYKPLDVEETVVLCAKLVEMFEENNINVIRVGLHDGSDVKENFVTGAYHPALGELIYGEIYFNKIIKLLESKKEAKILVNPSIISQVIGQKRRNLERLNSLNYKISVIPDKNLKIGEIKVI